ncbi:hypothetical protein EDD85DRAFT_786757 [Armillaria nabsnona]|nr:hypothetical protein EDD85DRAFT_786757 [Armillaria nabsnona]
MARTLMFNTHPMPLRPRNGYDPDDIKMLTDEEVNKPTRHNILEALVWIVEDSGHGGQVPDKNGDEIDQNDEGFSIAYFLLVGQSADNHAFEDILCYDSLIIIDDQLRKYTEYSGPCLLVVSLRLCSIAVIPGRFWYNCIGQCCETTSGSDISADVICWSGAKDNQTSADTLEGGVMTSAFIKVFEYNPKQSYKELLHSIRTIVECGYYKQIPQLGSSLPIDTNSKKVAIVGEKTVDFGWIFQNLVLLSLGITRVTSRRIFLGRYETLGDDASPEECTKLFGRMTSDYQEHLVVRILARDLHDAYLPVLRTGQTVETTRAWIRRVDEERFTFECSGKPSTRANNEVLALCEDKSIKWVEDDKWAEKMRLLVTLLGEYILTTKSRIIFYYIPKKGMCRMSDINP